MLELFPNNADLSVFLATDPQTQRLTRDLPSTDIARSNYIDAVVKQLRAHGLDRLPFFARLAQQFPGKRDDIDRAREQYLTDEKNGQLMEAQGRGASPPARKALLRALLPFEDGDHLVGRDTEIQDLVTIVTSSDFRFGVVWGPTGCGKTSILRAGLLPALRQNGFRAYLPYETGR